MKWIAKQRRRSLPGSSSGSSMMGGETTGGDSKLVKAEQKGNGPPPEQRRESRRDRQRSGFFGRRRSNSLASERSCEPEPSPAPRAHRRTHSMGTMGSVLAYNVDVAAHPMHHRQLPPHLLSTAGQMPAKSSLKKPNKPFSVNDAAKSSSFRADHQQVSDQAFSDNLWESPMSLSHYGSGRSDGQVRVPLRAQQQQQIVSGRVVGRYGQTVHYLNGSGRSQLRAPLGQEDKKQQTQQLKQLESSVRTQRTAASTPTDSTVSSAQGIRAPLQPRPHSGDALSVSSRRSVSSQTRRRMPPTNVSNVLMRPHPPVHVRHDRPSSMAMPPQNHPRHIPSNLGSDFRHQSPHHQNQPTRTALKQPVRTDRQFIPRQHPPHSQPYPLQYPYHMQRQYSQPTALKSALKKTPEFSSAVSARSVLQQPASYVVNRQSSVRSMGSMSSHHPPAVQVGIAHGSHATSSLQRPQLLPQYQPPNFQKSSPIRKLTPPQTAAPAVSTRQPTPQQRGGDVLLNSSSTSGKMSVMPAKKSMSQHASAKSFRSAKSYSLPEERPPDTDQARQLSSSSDDNSVPSVRSAARFDKPPPVTVIAKPSVTTTRPRGRSVSPKHDRHQVQRRPSVSSLPPALNRQHQPSPKLQRQGSSSSLIHQSMMSKFLSHAVINSKGTTTTVTASQTSSPESDAINSSTSPFRSSGAGGSGDESYASVGGRDAGSVHSVPTTFRYPPTSVTGGTKGSVRSSMPKPFSFENSQSAHDPYGDARSVATIGDSRSVVSNSTVGSTSARSQHRRRRNMAPEFVATEEGSVVSTTSAPAKFHGHQQSLPAPYQRGDDSSAAGSFSNGRFSTNQRLRMGTHNGNIGRAYDGGDAGSVAGSVASQRSANSRSVHPAPNTWDVNPKMEQPDDWSLRDGASVGTTSPGSTRTSKSMVTVGATEIRLLKRSLSESLIFGTMGQPRGANGGPRVGPLPDTNGWTEFGPEMGFNDRGETSGDDTSQLMDSARRKDKSRKQLGALRRSLSETKRRRTTAQVLPPPPPLMDRGRRRSRSVPVASPRRHAEINAEKMLAAQLRVLSGDAEEPIASRRHRGYSVPPTATHAFGEQKEKKQKKDKKDKKSSKKKSKKGKKKSKAAKEDGRSGGRESSSIASSDHTTLSNPSTTRSLTSTVSHPSTSRQLTYIKRAITPHLEDEQLENVQVCQ